MRADPDVIMVGEIRDLETAKMAADSAITGHQVFSTLHTNDASSAVNRLVEMGVPRYLVAAAWRCFVAQRLVRRLCPSCRSEETMTEARWLELGLGPAPRKRFKIWEPVGCAKCFGTGYRGRVGLYEVLTVDDDLRDLDRHRRQRARDPAGRPRQGRRVPARGRHRQGPRGQHQLPRTAPRHHLSAPGGPRAVTPR